MTSSTRPSPAFQFYPDQFLADTLGLTPLERGAFIALVCAAWRHRVLPLDTERLRQMTGVPSDLWPACWKAVALLCFQKEDGWHVPFVDMAIELQDKYRAMQSEKGRKGGRPRTKSRTEAAAKPRDSTEKPRPSSSSSASTRGKTSTPSPSSPEPSTPAGSPALAATDPRRIFTDGWAKLFAKHRDGAKYAFEGAKDGQHVSAILQLASGGTTDPILEALRRAEVHLTDPFFAERGANLGTFRSQWNRCVHADGNGNGHAPLPRAIQAFKDYAQAHDRIIIDVTEPKSEKRE